MDRPRPLPPGQRAVAGFPRFGGHLHRPPPAVPAMPVIEIGGGAFAGPVRLPVADLGTLPRREITADFHCVAGWSARDLHWEGVPFDELYRTVVAPALDPDAEPTHVVFQGLDRFTSVVAIEDALSGGLLIADRLDGLPLSADHGAPARVVSPDQYGFVSTKHLCRIEVHTGDADACLRRASGRDPVSGFLVRRHPRARVWREERHPVIPLWLVRPLYRVLAVPIGLLSRLGEGH